MHWIVWFPLKPLKSVTKWNGENFIFWFYLTPNYGWTMHAKFQCPAFHVSWLKYCQNKLISRKQEEFWEYVYHLQNISSEYTYYTSHFINIYIFWRSASLLKKKGHYKILRYIPGEECFVGVGGGLAPVQLVHGAPVDKLRLYLHSLGHTVHQHSTYPIIQLQL